MTTGNRTVLVVDDDDDMRFLMGMYAAEAGYEVAAQAGDGNQAVEQWREHRDRGQPLDAIVLDQMMPMCTGLQAATTIREEDQDVVLVLISAAMSGGLSAAARGAGVQHALSKNDLRALTAVLAA